MAIPIDQVCRGAMATNTLILVSKCLILMHLVTFKDMVQMP